MLKKSTVLVAVLVVGVIAVLWFMMQKPRPVQTTTAATNAKFDWFGAIGSVGSWLSDKVSSPSSIPVSHGGSGAWDSGGDQLLPLSPGSSAYEGSTEHDYLLS